MTSAGRILIMPKGNYDSSVTYEMLDLVFHSGASWVAKKTATGIEPSEANTEHWMKMCESLDLTEILQRIAALEAQMLGTISLDDIDLSNYLTLDGGNLRGQIGVGNGRGRIAATDDASYFTAYEDAENYRSLKIVNSIREDDKNHLVQIVNCANGQVAEYYLFGEHSIDLLNQYIDARINEKMK